MFKSAVSCSISHILKINHMSIVFDVIIIDLRIFNLTHDLINTEVVDGLVPNEGF